MCEAYDVVVGHPEEEWLIPSPLLVQKQPKKIRFPKKLAVIIIVRNYHSTYTPEQFKAWESGE